jgi:DNA-binding response OmpR family regulator
MKKILIIEDDLALLKSLVANLEAENFQVLSAEDGEKGLKLAQEEKIDLIILDVVLPEINGFEICKELRTKGFTMPIIMLTGKKKEEIDKVVGLEIGADDYITKPFGPKELLARIRAVLRRTATPKIEIEEYSFGDVHLDFKKQEAIKGKKRLHLSPREFEIMKYLIEHEGEVISREILLNEIWGYEEFPTTRTIDTFVHDLRKKLEDNPSKPKHLLTVPWAGYKFKK